MTDNPTYAPAVDTTWRRMPDIGELLRIIEGGEMIPRSDLLTLARLVRELFVRPVPGETVNAGKIVRHVIDGNPAEPGLLRSWWVAAEDPETGEWVTWEAAALDGSMAGRIGYNAGDYFGGPDPAVNRRRALRSLASRAGVPVATERMDADEAIGQLMTRMRPYQLRYDDAVELVTRAGQHLRLEMRAGKAGLTAYEAGDHTLRYDLREVDAS